MPQRGLHINPCDYGKRLSKQQGPRRDDRRLEPGSRCYAAGIIENDPEKPDEAQLTERGDSAERMNNEQMYQMLTTALGLRQCNEKALFLLDYQRPCPHLPVTRRTPTMPAPAAASRRRPHVTDSTRVLALLVER